MSSLRASGSAGLIGASLARPDALGKVTGDAKYPADLVKPGMLHLRVVFAHHVHARIHSLDARAALAYPGVVAVLTAADVPYNAFGLIDADQPVLAGEVVRFEGDKVALVVAESKDAADEGARLVKVEYEDLPALADARAALAADVPLGHEELGTNVQLHLPIRKGDAEAALAQADVVLDGEFETSWQEHAFLQPEAGVAFVDEQGRVVVETAGQWLHEDRRQIAAMLKLPEDQVIVRYVAIGGAFGGREDLSLQHLLALAAWKLQRPIALVWGREESMIAHHKRHPFSIRCRWGAMRDGTITAVRAELVADGGAYASTSVEVTKVATLFASGCYEIPNISVDGYAVYTNNVPCGAFRGFGAPQAQLAAEIMVTRLAHALGMDPAELRQRNIYREGSLEPTQNPLPAGVSALPVLERCVEEARARLGYGRPREQPAEPHLRRGVGIACGIKNVGYSFGYQDQATATVELFGTAELERAVVRIGAADVGQGAHLALQQIAAETLGVPLDNVRMVTDDSGEAPNAGSASASRMTLMGGRAVHDAALAARERWSASEDYHGAATVQFRPTPTTPFAPGTGAGTPNYCYGYAAQAVEVEVNTLTGLVRVLKVISVHDVGRAINRQQVEGQIEGCLAQALGYALLERFQVKDGHVLTPYFSTYLLPTAL
ncbi:MAG TPA: xanthine dehydrogenase family protein molybdopterin-binding subunit, partial [Ktedonobacterales bacterium]|nr:xanthine dehydrogenase family protein molybdopterin-binding subunit [Ktedonobacterales bacterium]